MATVKQTIEDIGASPVSKLFNPASDSQHGTYSFRLGNMILHITKDATTI